MDLKNKAVETLFVILSSVVLVLIGMYYAKIVFFLYPIFFIILGIKYGINYAILNLAISSILIGLITDTASGAFVFVAFAPLIISIIYTLKGRKNSFIILVVSTIVFLVSVLLIIGIMKKVAGINIIKEIEGLFTQILDYQTEMLRSTELSNYEVLRIKDFLENAYDYIILIMPSIIIIFSLIIAHINYLLSIIFLRKLGYGVINVPRFSRFRLPNNILLGTGIMFLGAFVLMQLRLKYYQAVFINISVIVSFFFFIQGLSVVDFVLVRKGANVILRLFLVILFTIVIPLGWIVPFIGVFDAILDFRKLKKPV